MLYLPRFYILLAIIPLSTSLGINCRGSGFCPLATFENESQEGIIQGLRDAIYASEKPDSTLYNSGDHVICVSSTIAISFGYGPVGLGGQLGSGGICAFPQSLVEPLSLGSIKKLADASLGHGCTSCGSVPVHFVDMKNNDPGKGILTFNYVASPSCTGNCISASGQSGSGNDGNGGFSTTPTVEAPTAADATTSVERSITTASALVTISSVEAATVTVSASSSDEATPTSIAFGSTRTTTTGTTTATATRTAATSSTSLSASRRLSVHFESGAASCWLLWTFAGFWLLSG